MRRWFIFILLVCFISAEASGKADKRREPETEETDTVVKRYRRLVHPFADSFRTDSTRKVLLSRFSINLPQQRIPRIKDPFDPFAHQAYYRRGQGKFWFFTVSLVILGLLLYYRAAFPKQFVQRMKGVWNKHYFEELISDYSLSFTGGSIICMSFSTLVMAQMGLLLVLYNRYIHLNSLVFYLVMVLGILIWRGLVYFSQRLQAYVLNTGETLRMMIQRQISVDMWVAFVVFPLVNVLYFNASRLAGWPVQPVLSILLVTWLAIRIFSEFAVVVREGPVSFTRILYFCALEFLPHALLATALLRIPATQ